MVLPTWQVRVQSCSRAVRIAAAVGCTLCRLSAGQPIWGVPSLLLEQKEVYDAAEGVWIFVRHQSIMAGLDS